MEHVYVALNVGGQMFHIRLASLRSIPRTLLTDLIDASLPLDLVFGGRAISEEDEIESAGGVEAKHGTESKAEVHYNSTGISTNGALVTPSHPYERAKYVYLSHSNTFRPIRTTARSRSSDATSSPSGHTQEQKASKEYSSSPSSSKSPSSSSPPALTDSLDNRRSPSCLFVPATCLTSPRHKPVVLPSNKPKQRMEGFTNKSFHADEDHLDRTKPLSNHIGASNSLGDTKTSVFQGHNSIHDLEAHQEHESGVKQPLEVDASSLIRLPQAVHADIYIDRNPLLFPYILDLYRNGQLHLPPDLCSLTIRMELDFWKIPEELIGECCWREFQTGLDRMAVVSAISATLTNRFDDPEVRDQLTKAGRFWLTMERPDYSKRAKIWCGVYYLCILLSTITFMMLTLDEFQEIKPEFKSRFEEYTNDNDTLHVVHYGTFFKPTDWLEGTEICLDIFFTLEFAARLITCPDKKEFVRNKHNIIDILILSTAWTRCIYDRIITWDHENFTEARSFAMVVLNSMLGLRVLRMLHLAKIFRTLKVMYLSILASMQELALLVVVMAAGVLLFGSALFIAEGFSTPDSEPLQFASIPEAMWWAIITMTTVGYGDYYPVHAAGYVVGAICAVSGLLLVAMPIAIVASNFSIFYDNMSSRDQSLRRQAMLGQMIGIAMATQDGVGGEHGDGGITEATAVKVNDIKSGLDFEMGDSTLKARNVSDSRTLDTKEATEMSKPLSQSDGITSDRGDAKLSSKESSHRKDTGNSRKSRQEKKQRTSSATRRDPTSSDNQRIPKESRERNVVHVGEEETHHKSRDGSGGESFTSRLRDRSPMTVEYVGIRANGTAKEERLESRDKNRHRNTRSRPRSGQSTVSQLSPVG